MPPTPSGVTISYGPSFWPAARGMRSSGERARRMRDVPAARQRNTRRGRPLAECSWPGPRAGDPARSARGPGTSEWRHRASDPNIKPGTRIVCQVRKVPEDPILVGAPTRRVVAATPGRERRIVAANQFPEILREAPGMLLVHGFRAHARPAARASGSGVFGVTELRECIPTSLAGVLYS